MCYRDPKITFWFRQKSQLLFMIGDRSHSQILSIYCDWKKKQKRNYSSQQAHHALTSNHRNKNFVILRFSYKLLACRVSLPKSVLLRGVNLCSCQDFNDSYTTRQCLVLQHYILIYTVFYPRSCEAIKQFYWSVSPCFGFSLKTFKFRPWKIFQT